MQTKPWSIIPASPTVSALLCFSQEFIFWLLTVMPAIQMIAAYQQIPRSFLFSCDDVCAFLWDLVLCFKDIPHDLKVSTSYGIDTQSNKLENNLKIQCPKWLPVLSHHSMVTLSHFGICFFSENYFKLSLIIFWGENVEPLPGTFILKNLYFFLYNDVKKPSL